MAIDAAEVAPAATVPTAANGAVGAEYVTPMLTVVVAVFTTPAIVAVAVIVYEFADVTVVGVPEIVPVAVSKVRPAGSEPVIAYVAVAPDSAKSVVVIGVSATLTDPVADGADVLIAGLVINVAVEIEDPVPAELVAVTEPMY